MLTNDLAMTLEYYKQQSNDLHHKIIKKILSSIQCTV